MAERRYVVITFEVAFIVSSETADEIRSTMDDLRGQAAARAIAARVLENDAEYDEWYKGPGITEVEIPMPQIVRFD